MRFFFSFALMFFVVPTYLVGCTLYEEPKVGYESYSPEELRAVSVKITSNDPKLEYWQSNKSDNSVSWGGRYSKKIGRGNFNGEILVPIGQQIEISPSGYDESEYKVSRKSDSSIIGRKTETINLEYESIYLIDDIRNRYKELSKNQKVKLQKAVSLYKEALHSPNYLYEMKLAEAEGAVSIFYQENSHERISPLGYYINSIQGAIGLLNISKMASGYSAESRSDFNKRVFDIKKRLSILSNL